MQFNYVNSWADENSANRKARKKTLRGYNGCLKMQSCCYTIKKKGSSSAVKNLLCCLFPSKKWGWEFSIWKKSVEQSTSYFASNGKMWPFLLNTWCGSLVELWFYADKSEVNMDKKQMFIFSQKMLPGSHELLWVVSVCKNGEKNGQHLQHDIYVAINRGACININKILLKCKLRSFANNRHVNCGACFLQRCSTI